MNSIGFGYVQQTNININISFGGAGKTAAQQGAGQLQALQSLMAMYNSISQAQTAAMSAPPKAACVPRPDMSMSAAPAGKGLTQIGPNSYRTAGGYTITATGKNASWTIKGPDGKLLSTVHGDPHVTEGDGTRWDFTKDSDFVLPDGTRIMCDTTSQKGKSVTKGLQIINGSDRAEIKDIDKNKPKSASFNDGFEYRAQHAAGQARDSFYLAHGKAAGTKETVQFVRERNGNVDGVVTGAKYKNGVYEQKTSKKEVMLPMDRPPVGSPAWGNYARGFMTDLIAEKYQGMGDYGKYAAQYVGQEMHLNDMMGKVQTANNALAAAFGLNKLGAGAFGGWACAFPGGLGQPLGLLVAFSSLFGSGQNLAAQVALSQFSGPVRY